MLAHDQKDFFVFKLAGKKFVKRCHRATDLQMTTDL